MMFQGYGGSRIIHRKKITCTQLSLVDVLNYYYCKLCYLYDSHTQPAEELKLYNDLHQE